MLKLSLTRLGSKKRPVYRIAAMKALTQRDGKAVAYLGNYFPLEDSRVTLQEDAIIKFLLNGAQPTSTVKSLLMKAGVWAKFEEAKKN